jgi:ABC-type polysaccharide/polyol phosphate transport system ATPase subunit
MAGRQDSCVSGSAPNLSIALELSTHTPSEAEAPAGAEGGVSAPGTSAPAIVAAGVSKTFRLPHNAPVTLKERALHPFRRIEVEKLQALDDVSFEVAKGEFFGIVGRNGGGKSTLLKLIAGIYQPNGGEIHVEGRLSPFIDLGVGFHPELAARDNIVINCSLLGLTRAEALRRFDSIIEFAELERFVDLKLKNYSSGMQVRLAFSTAIQVDADILLLDEVLAVGDWRFQAKCFEVFRQMKRDGRTIVLVTHSMDIVRRFCDRALFIDRGAVQSLGDTDEVVDHYMAAMRQRGAATGQSGWAETGHYGDGTAEVMEAWFEDSSGTRAANLRQGERFAICAEVRFHSAMREPVFGFHLRNERGDTVLSLNTGRDKSEKHSFEAGERASFRLELDNVLTVGRYFADPLVAHNDMLSIADQHEGMATAVVDGEGWSSGIVELPHEFEVRRS